jgi:signal transduction histidine kinase
MAQALSQRLTSETHVLKMLSQGAPMMPEGMLDHTSRTRTVGIAITGIRERVKQLGGRLEIETGRKGTKVKATIPNRHFRTLARGDTPPSGMLGVLTTGDENGLSEG